jgi:hypothetical protein
MNATRGREHDEDAREAPSLPAILRQSSGLAAILVLACYCLFQTLTAEKPAHAIIVAGTVAKAAEVVRLQQPVYIGGKAFYPAPPAEPQLIIHFACDQEDARIVRLYDALPGGRNFILRLDQSAEEMRNVYRGTDPHYPSDLRIVTTPCMQALFDGGEFP